MIERSGNSLGFYAFYTASKIGSTGLTVTVNVWERIKGGATAKIKSAVSATEIGDGLYEYVLPATDVDAEAEYIAVFKTDNLTVDQRDIPALWTTDKANIENLDNLPEQDTSSTTVGADGEFGTIPADLWD